MVLLLFNNLTWTYSINKGKSSLNSLVACFILGKVYCRAIWSILIRWLASTQEVADLNPAEVTYKQRAHVKWAFLFIPISHKTLTKQPLFKIKKAPSIKRGSSQGFYATLNGCFLAVFSVYLCCYCAVFSLCFRCI